MGLEKFIQNIKESIQVNEDREVDASLLKAIESFKNKLSAEIPLLKDLSIARSPKWRGGVFTFSLLVSASSGISIEVSIGFVTQDGSQTYDRPTERVYLVFSSIDLKYLNKEINWYTKSIPAEIKNIRLRATYNIRSNQFEEFKFDEGKTVADLVKALEFMQQKEKTTKSTSFKVNLNYNQETREYNLSLLDNRSSIKTDLAGITQELRMLGISDIENTLELAQTKGKVSLIIKPAQLTKSGIAFK